MGRKHNPLKKEWTWGYEKTGTSGRIHGAVIKRSKIEWWSDGSPGYANGYYSSQSIDDFLRNGPGVADVPHHILDEMAVTIKQIKRNHTVRNIKISAMHLLHNSFHGLTVKEWASALKKRYPGENLQTIHTILNSIIEKNSRVQHIEDGDRGIVYTHINLLL
jgi:hypothetical protein